jgi:hypothetical protein
LTHHQINARDYPMRPTETRYLSAIGGILLLATITACSPKPNNNVSQAPEAAVSTPASPKPPTESVVKPPAPIPATTQATEPTAPVASAELDTKPPTTVDQPIDPPSRSTPTPEDRSSREPSRSSDAQDQRVNFGKGESSAVLKGAVVRAESKTYLVNAAKDQVMDLDISALEDNAVVQVITPTGQVIGSEIKTMNKALPETGDYQIIVSGTRGNATYKLNVAVK